VSEYVICDTNLGWVGGVLRDGRLRATILPAATREQALRQLAALGGDRPATDAAAAALAERLRRGAEGQDAGFTAEELDVTDGTPFQQAVWRVLLEIPCGETRSYAWVAHRIGLPRAARAVGRAVASNRLPIVVPCHRVIGADGGLHGFGGGLPLKAALLRAEGVTILAAATG